MGAWGFGVFDDDTALDEVGAFAARPSVARLSRMLDAAVSRANPDDVIASRALVAAELVAALRGHPTRQLPEEVRGWIERQASSVSPALAKQAVRALAAIVRKSELRDTWADAGTLSKWRRAMQGLERRLSSRPRSTPTRRAKARTSAITAADEGPLAPGSRPSPGATYLMPLEGGYLGACRVIRAAGPEDLLPFRADLSAKRRERLARDLVVVVTSPWVGKKPPTLDEPELRDVLRLTHGEWQGALQVYVGVAEVPPDFKLLGHIEPSAADKLLKGGPFPNWTWRGQQLLQMRWDAEHGASGGRSGRAAATSSKAKRQRPAKNTR